MHLPFLPHRRPGRRLSVCLTTAGLAATLLIGLPGAGDPGARTASAARVATWQVGTPTVAMLDGAPFWPAYFPATWGSNARLVGLFDSRPLKQGEAILAAHSTDGGRTWTSAGRMLEFTGVGSPSDIGQGHPYAFSVNGHTYLYTLDRQEGVKGISGLTVHQLHADLSTLPRQPLDGLPTAELPPPLAPAGTVAQTSGLLAPDGILSAVPGYAYTPTGLVPAANTTVILYLQKALGATPVEDVTTVRIAQTSDGVEFTDLGAVYGLGDATTIWVGPRGTLTKLTDETGARWGLFFSGGIRADEDSDAFHYIGYAESPDLLTWNVIHGVANPLVSCNEANPTGPCNLSNPADAPNFYSGRVYSPAVTFSEDGRDATLTFAAYRTSQNAKDVPGNRFIATVPLTRTDK